MRPLELRLAHFGPYRDAAVLNFEALDRLFLVCGPTGAGKTTLFDALTYALYEKTAGTRGGLADQLASHHAPEGAVPEVSLRFALGAQQWRVTRQLRHRVPKKKGEGWTVQDPQVLLEKRVEDGWEPVAGKRSEINQRLEDMLGLSSEEFAKIVVLPQGDFQRFLEASTGDREKMLQKLFPVEAYDRMVEALKLRAKTVEDARRRWEDRWQELTAQIGQGADDRPALEAACAEANAAAQGAADQESRAATALTQLRSLHEDWAKLAAKKDEQARLEVRRQGWEADKLRLDRARKARPLGTDLDRQDAIKAEGLGLRADQDKAKETLARVEGELQAYQAREGDREARELRLAEVMKQRGLAEHQVGQWKEVQTLRAQESAAQEAQDRATESWERARGAVESAQAALTPPTEDNASQLMTRLEQARTADREARDREQAAVQRAQWEDRLATATREATENQQSLETAVREEALWRQMVEALGAAALAATLREGAPCPVCGSTQHPLPARWPEAAAEAPARLEAARRALDLAQTQAAGAQARWETLQAQRSSFTAPGDGPSSAETGPALGEAQARFEAFQKSSQAQEETKKTLEAALVALNQADQGRLDAQRTKESWSIRLQALADALPQDPGPGLAALKAEETTLRTQLEAERRRAEVWAQEREGLRAKINGWETRLEAQRDEFRRLQTQLESAVATLGWRLDEVRQARIAEADLTTLEERVAAFDRELHRLEGETAALEAKFPGGAPPPLDPEVRALDELRLRRRGLEALAKEAEFRLRDRDRIDDELRDVNRQKDALEAEFQQVVPLARALDGHNGLNLRLTTWVLVQALEQVARSATHRLAAMSGGRYALKVQTRGSDARKDWGLDLAVVDGYTGQERAVGTLSGGEKFMTSISLALGLADVIQERSGGLKLEAIFIDEGFGTLDDQSLDRAMAILHDLGQHRSVGIISHVAELRQRINSRVEVIKGKNGSTLLQ